jgi:hypothetical protein
MGHDPWPKTASVVRARWRRGARPTRGHRVHGPRSAAADGGPPVDGRQRGTWFKHRRVTGDTSDKVVEPGSHHDGGGAERSFDDSA